ncbi:hypothetical protein C8R45DRAFT_1148855 [Mycena sanguinolenta]|nr:hypothetical protein C8R45DRAFT_1148855 [Mycena sanguinolenta]
MESAVVNVVKVGNWSIIPLLVRDSKHHNGNTAAARNFRFRLFGASQIQFRYEDLAAARNNWKAAVDTIKSGTKCALEILTPPKKKRKIAVEKENGYSPANAETQPWREGGIEVKNLAKEVLFAQKITRFGCGGARLRGREGPGASQDAQSISDHALHDDASEHGSFETPSCLDDDPFTAPRSRLVRGFDGIPDEAHPQFGLFSTNTRSSPSKSSSLGRFWSDFTPHVLKFFLPSPKSTNPRIFDDDESILAQRSPCPTRMLDDSSSFANSEFDSLDFDFSPADFVSAVHPGDSASLDSLSIALADATDPGPTFSSPTDADLAEHARQREEVAAKSDGQLREAPTIEAARAALDDIGKVLRPPRKKGHGYIDPELDSFTRSRTEGIQSLALYTHLSSSTRGKWKKASMNVAIKMRHGTYCARVLRCLARQYIADRSVLPENPYGNWNQTLLINEDLCNELMEYLQLLGSTKDDNGRESGITSAKVQAWLARPELMNKYGITKQISLATAKQYLHHGHQMAIHKPDGSFEKEKIPMTGAAFSDEQSQSLYVESGPNVGLFKGMQQNLIERGYKVKGKRAERDNFQCALDADDHCAMHSVVPGQGSSPSPTQARASGPDPSPTRVGLGQGPGSGSEILATLSTRAWAQVGLYMLQIYD